MQNNCPWTTRVGRRRNRILGTKQRKGFRNKNCFAKYHSNKGIIPENSFSPRHPTLQLRRTLKRRSATVLSHPRRASYIRVLEKSRTIRNLECQYPSAPTSHRRSIVKSCAETTSPHKQASSGRARRIGRGSTKKNHQSSRDASSKKVIATEEVGAS
jgi:hypothetical protein